MGKIVLLDDLTINQIAAGEVIERPASVVKEMVENSIDAGATNITVEIKNGGISYIRITDNGSGIAADDMEIAFERHATSKIRSAGDLDTVRTMGFRGEALASIAAIANVEMVSKTATEENGHKIVVEGGEILEKSEAASPVGTSITVKNLFYNTPVRYKFLKKDYTESGYIEDAITRIALVNKNVAIKLINSGKTIIQTNGDGNSKNVIYNIFGKDIAKAIIDVEYEYEDVKIYGVIGKPEIARSNRNNQLFFVNNRFIKDKNLTAAADQAYKGMIPIGRFGFCVLNIDMDPRKLDVNVHPAKLEVRFQEESKIFKAVYHAIKSGLAQTELIEIVNRAGYQEDKSLFEVKEEQKEEKNKASGLFKKFNRYDDENEEEISNNKLKEIYEFRKGMKDLGIPEVSATPQISELIKKEQNDKEYTQIIKVQSAGELYTESEKTVENPEENQEIIVENSEENENDRKFGQTKQIENVMTSIEQDNSSRTQIIDTNEVREALKKEGKHTSSEEDFLEMYKKTFGTTGITKNEEKVEEKQEEVKEEVEDENKLSNREIINEFLGKNKEEKQEESEVENLNMFEAEESYVPKTKYKFVGIVFNTYIIIEYEGEMYIIDQHAAHERINYESIKQNYYNDENKDSQFLLLPDIINLSHKEMEKAKSNIPLFEKAGFTVEEFGDNTLKLTGVPSMFETMDTKELFLDILDEIDSVNTTARQEIEEKFIATIACKASIKANMKITKEEVDKLMDRLLELPNPFTCPHGRPTAIKMSKTEIEKKFSRR